MTGANYCDQTVSEELNLGVQTVHEELKNKLVYYEEQSKNTVTAAGTRTTRNTRRYKQDQTAYNRQNAPLKAKRKRTEYMDLYGLYILC